MVKRRKYIVLVRRGNPKQVTFNGRTFNANFEEVKEQNCSLISLLLNIKGKKKKKEFRLG